MTEDVTPEKSAHHYVTFPREIKDVPPQKFAFLICATEMQGKSMYLEVQEVYFTSWLTSDLFQSFGFYFHQIKQPFAVANFFWPLDVQGCRAKVFKRFPQVNYL